MFSISPAEWTVLAVWIAGVAAAIYSARGDVSLSRRLLALAVAAFLPASGSVVAFALAILRFRQDRLTGFQGPAD